MSPTSRTPQDMIEMMVNANDKNEYAQAILVFDELRADDEVSSRIFRELLRRMISDLDNEKLQERLGKILRDMHALQDFVEANPEEASVACFGYGLIWNESSNLDYFFPDIPDVVRGMSRHEMDPVVQEYAIRFMAQLMRDHKTDLMFDEDVIAEIEGVPDILHVCLQAMRNHPNNVDVQKAACDALWLFEFDAVIDQEWPPVTILQALNNHVHCAEVQESACDCLGYLLKGVQEGFCLRGRDYFKEKWPTLGGEELFLAGRDYVEAVLRALQTHPTNEKVQGAALCVLARMTVESASLNCIIQGGGVDLIIRAMHMFGGKTAGLGAIMILKPLFGCSTDARRKAIELGAIPMLLKVLQQDYDFEEIAYKNIYEYEYESYVSWCGAVCATLNELFLENIDKAVSFQIANEGGIKLIVDLTVKYVKPVSLPLTESINRFSHSFELKDGDILAHLATVPAGDGKLPLHYAADRALLPFSEGQMAVLEHLLKVYPEAATVRDGSGRLPLHIAIESRASLSILEVLLRANPDTGEAVCRNRDFMLNFPPVLMAAASDCNLECIFALLRYAPRITNELVTFTSRKQEKPPA